MWCRAGRRNPLCNRLLDVNVNDRRRRKRRATTPLRFTKFTTAAGTAADRRDGGEH